MCSCCCRYPLRNGSSHELTLIVRVHTWADTHRPRRPVSFSGAYKYSRIATSHLSFPFLWENDTGLVKQIC